MYERARQKDVDSVRISYKLEAPVYNGFRLRPKNREPRQRSTAKSLLS